MRGCSICDNANTCTTCDAANNYVADDTNGQCKCNDGFYPDDALGCVNCNTITGCLTCTAANTCTTCDPNGNFVPVANNGVCECQNSYYLNGQVCALCNTIIP
jgi:proprotein convertase subtilisin/kexin type 5